MTTKKKGLFVKSADTKVTAANSRAEVEKVLRRYGAVGFSVAREFTDAGLLSRIVCEFIVPDTMQGGAAPFVPVRLPVDVRRIYDALYGRPTRYDYDAQKRVHNPKGYFEHGMEQAERVAWRNLMLWIDAALSAVAAGLQTVIEAFLAHTLIVHENGRTERMADYIKNVRGALSPGVRALLASPAEAVEA